MELDYNLAELDSALSEVRHQEAAVRGPPRDAGRSRTSPGTRRGSLVPTNSASLWNSGGQPRQLYTPKLNLFHFDLRELVKELLVTRGESRVAYHEYAVFSPPDANPTGERRTPSIMAEGEEALRMFRQAIKSGHGLNDEVSSLSALMPTTEFEKCQSYMLVMLYRPRNKGSCRQNAHQLT